MVATIGDEGGSTTATTGADSLMGSGNGIAEGVSTAGVSARGAIVGREGAASEGTGGVTTSLTTDRRSSDGTTGGASSPGTSLAALSVTSALLSRRVPAS
jgi:hypothetical protein